MNRFKWLTVSTLIFFVSGCTLYSGAGPAGSSSMSSADGNDPSSYGMGMDGDD